MPAVNIHRNSINDKAKNMEDNMDTKYQRAFFFGNVRSIINTQHLFMIRPPYEPLNYNKETQGRRNSYENNATYKEGMELTIFQTCRQLQYARNRLKLEDYIPLVQKDRYSLWVRMIWHFLVPMLCLTHMQFPDCCNDISPSILDIRWDITCLIILILFNFKSTFHFLNSDIVFKSQLHDWVSIIKEAILSVTYNFKFELRDFLFKIIATRLEVTHLTDNVGKIISRKGNNNINKKLFFLKKSFILLTMINMIQFPSGTLALRCYTDKSATKSYSQECGLNTGCVKIYIDSQDMLYRKQLDMGHGYGYKPGKSSN